MTKIEAFKCDDGKVFEYEPDAKRWEIRVRNAKKAQKIWDDGNSLASALAACYDGAFDVAFCTKFNKDTLLKISHWQCKDVPGYGIMRFNPDDTVFVYGNVGAWTGPYGRDVKMDELFSILENQK